MHALLNQELARQHLAELTDAAAHERTSSRLERRAKRFPLPPALLRRVLVIEPDFVAIRRDLRLTLSEWCLETGPENLETIMDIFMRHLRMRLGYAERRKQRRI